MTSKEIEIKTPNGLHLRVAAKVVERSRRSQSKVIFYKDGQKADASSILELLVLGAGQDSSVRVEAKGQDSESTVKDISLVLMDGAGI